MSEPTFSGTSPHFSHPFYRGLSFPVVAALRLLAPRTGSDILTSEEMG
jgi:hypothetical protein